MEKPFTLNFLLLPLCLLFVGMFSPTSFSQPNSPASAEEDDFKSLLTEAQSAVIEYYNTHQQWFEEKRQTQKRVFKLAEGILEIAKDKQIQKASLELMERFKFKPLILAEVLLLLLTLVLRSARSRKKMSFIRSLMEHFFISTGYVLAAFVLVPTIFLGTNYLYLVWTLTSRIYLLLQAGLGPAA